MSDNGDIEFTLRQVAVFRDATDEDIRAMTAIATTRSIEEGAFIFSQGDPADSLYVLLQGRAKLAQLARDGQQVNLRTLHPRHIFGAVGAIDVTATYPASAQALENSTVISIRSDRFRDLLATRPHLAFGLMKLMTGYIQEMQARYREMATERVEQRIARVLLRLTEQAAHGNASPPAELSFSRQELAEMAGTTLYTVSRTLSAWERQGFLTTGRGRVALVDHAAIEALAEGNEGSLRDNGVAG